MPLHCLALLTVLSFWCWVATVALFIARSFAADRRFCGRQALVWGSLSLIFAGCWAVGLTLA